MAAPAYIEQLMAWVQANIDNESVMPSKIGKKRHLNLLFSMFEFLNLAVNVIHRRAVSQIIWKSNSPNLQENVPCVRSHLLPPLSRRPGAGAGASSKHQLQAVRALH